MPGFLSESEREELARFIVDLYKSMIPVKAMPPDLGGEGEAERAKVLEEIMRGIGLRVSRFDASDPRARGGVRPNLLSVVEGAGEGTLWVVAHIDTVPPGPEEAWRHPPFEVSVEDGKIYGRGVEDDGQGVAIALAAAKYLVEKGVRPRMSLGVALVSDEEAGSRYGLLHLLSENAFEKLSRGPHYFLVPDAGSPDGSRIIVAEKHIVHLRVVVEGKQVHASTPHLGVNACREAMRFNLLLDAAASSLLAGLDELYDPPVSTCEPTRREENIPNINTVPGSDVTYWDCRLLPRHSPRSLIDALKSTAYRFSETSSARARVEPVMVDEAGEPTSPSHPFVRGFAEAVRAVRGVEPRPIGIGGGTVARYLRRRGYPAIVWMTCAETAHMPDEWTRLDWVLGDTETLLYYLLSGQQRGGSEGPRA